MSNECTSSKKEKIRKKIESLLKKSEHNGASENEATTAMEVAKKLMNEYGITLEEVNKSKKEDFNEAFINEGRSNLHEVDLYGISLGIAKFTDTEIYTFKKDGRKAVVFFGYDNDTALAEYLREICRRAMETEWKNYSKNNNLKGHKRSHRKNFMIGMSNRIIERLREIKNQHINETSGTELIVAKSQTVKDALREKRIIKKKKSNNTTYYNKDSTFFAGKNAGNNVNLNNPVEHNNNNNTKITS